MLLNEPMDEVHRSNSEPLRFSQSELRDEVSELPPAPPASGLPRQTSRSGSTDKLPEITLAPDPARTRTSCSLGETSGGSDGDPGSHRKARARSKTMMDGGPFGEGEAYAGPSLADSEQLRLELLRTEAKVKCDGISADTTEAQIEEHLIKTFSRVKVDEEAASAEHGQWRDLLGCWARLFDLPGVVVLLVVAPLATLAAALALVGMLAGPPLWLLARAARFLVLPPSGAWGCRSRKGRDERLRAASFGSEGGRRRLPEEGPRSREERLRKRSRTPRVAAMGDVVATAVRRNIAGTTRRFSQRFSQGDSAGELGGSSSPFSLRRLSRGGPQAVRQSESGAVDAVSELITALDMRKGLATRLAERVLAISPPQGIAPSTVHLETSGDPRKEVNLRMIMSHLKQIDVRAHQFSAEVLVEAKWTDDHPMSWWRDRGYSGTDEISSELNHHAGRLGKSIWTPKLYFENLTQVDHATMRSEKLGGAGIVERWYKAFTLTKPNDPKPKLVISLRMRVVGTFASKFNVEWFPCDRQELTVAIRSQHPAHEIHLCMPRHVSKYPSICRLDNFVHADEWMLGKRVMSYESRSYTTDTLRVPPMIYASYHFKTKIARHWIGYAWDIVVPISALPLFSIASLLVPRDSLGERIAITLSMVLASLAFRSTFMHRIPTVDFLTAMDKIILVNFFLLFLLLVADVAFVFLPDPDGGRWLPPDVEIAQAKQGTFTRLEFYLACFFLAVWLLAIAVVFLLFVTASAANKHWLATKPEEASKQEAAKAEDIARSVAHKWRLRSSARRQDSAGAMASTRRRICAGSSRVLSLLKRSSRSGSTVGPVPEGA